MPRSGPGEDEVHRITDASPPHSDDLDQRMGRYLLSMLIRTVCFLLVFVVHGPARWACVAGALVLPYVAVVMANAGRPSAPPQQARTPARSPGSPVLDGPEPPPAAPTRA